MLDKSIQLASFILDESKKVQTKKEKRQQKLLHRMMQDPNGKAFTTRMTDECFRSKRPSRVYKQLAYLLKIYGIPHYLPPFDWFKLWLFKIFGAPLAFIFVPLAKYMLRQETSTVILPGEESALKKHLKMRRAQGIHINLNHLGEAILGEDEALKRLNLYLEDLKRDDIDTISVKISTIFSQINLLAWQECLNILDERLSSLYRASSGKIVNLDMEEYRDLHLTVELFKRVLDKPEFLHTSAGIVLQSYLPDSFPIQKELTEWAMRRKASGGAPIRLRIVKGANLSMEKVEASMKGWPQAPYLNKADVDANYKKMITYALQKEHAEAVHVGVASHNILDIAYGLVLRSENEVESYVTFEMLEGMADHTRRVVQALSKEMLLYCPAAKKEEFQNAVAYLIRRLDENTGPENFLRHSFGLTLHSDEWTKQVALFKEALKNKDNVSLEPRRSQNRFLPPHPLEDKEFSNEPDTDWSLPQNRKWADEIYHSLPKIDVGLIPLVIDCKEIHTLLAKVGVDPSHPGIVFYHYCQGGLDEAKTALKCAENTRKHWSNTSVEERYTLLGKVAQNFRIKRKELIQAMITDGGKTIPEADAEVSEAIDFAEYYRRMALELHAIPDIEWSPKGTALVISPWNFPCAIPAGGILAALMTGNTVIFKPSSDTVFVAWILINLFWDAGIPKDVLQFFPCQSDPIGDYLVQDERISFVILTGSTDTAKHILKTRPSIELMAETGGKNAFTITDLADRDLAIKDLIQSSFSHAGQKCSATSLAILEAPVYDDPHFLQQLKNATQSLSVSSAWNPKTKVPPLIKPPQDVLRQGLTQLEEGESWLLEPTQDPSNPGLWSPGIKLGTTNKSFTYNNELFGPVLSVMRAENLKEAITLANGTRYGLTSGLHSLDEREHALWLSKIEAGNCYINRTTTGAIVQRQPFGGCKESSFGPGAKAGGPNYLTQFMHAKEKGHLEPSYVYWWNKMKEKVDVSHILGQDNFFTYVPRNNLFFRIQEGDSEEDVNKVIQAAATCGAKLTISKNESEEAFLKKVSKAVNPRIRLLQKPSAKLLTANAHFSVGPVLNLGRLELLHYLREVSISYDSHRYGNTHLIHAINSRMD